MANPFVRLPDDTANLGKKEDHFLTSETQYREAVVVADTTDPAAGAKVRADAPASDDYGLVAREVNAPAMLAALLLIAASESVLDDWDESDRAKVNTIVGQVGVQGGAGAVTALTQRVAIATDANAVSVTATKAGTATLSNVPDNASNVTVLAANAARLGATFYNDSTAALYLKFGATASATSFTKRLLPREFLDITPTNYTGKVDAIWDTAPGGAMRVTELTA